MPRWGPHADDRLYRSAMQLIFERGYDEVTIAEIAEHAGLKKRSFFRYFPDKREVLFAGAADFERQIVAAVLGAPASVGPVTAATAALAKAGAGLAEWGEPVRHRQRVIETSTELRERELIKREALIAAVASALREREVEPLAATLCAQIAVAAFVTAFQRWTDATGPADFPSILEAVMEALREAVCGDP